MAVITRGDCTHKKSPIAILWRKKIQIKKEDENPVKTNIHTLLTRVYFNLFTKQSNTGNFVYEDNEDQ